MNSNFSKHDTRHWLAKVAFQSAKARTYSVQIQHQGKRQWVGLGTANKEQAAILARNLYQDIRANGWEAALARRRGAPVAKVVNVTIGEYVDAVAVKSLIRKPSRVTPPLCERSLPTFTTSSTMDRAQTGAHVWTRSGLPS
jgi:hypothetical protein